MTPPPSEPQDPLDPRDPPDTAHLRDPQMYDSVVQACRHAGLHPVIEHDERGLILRVLDPAGNLVCRTLFSGVDDLEQAAVNIALYLKPLLSIERVDRETGPTDELTVETILGAGSGSSPQEVIGPARTRAERDAGTALSELGFALEELAWLERTDWSTRGEGDDLLLIRSIANQLGSAIRHLCEVPVTVDLADDLRQQLAEVFGHLEAVIERLPAHWASHAELPRSCRRLRTKLVERGVWP
jgi:hypothetical protein